MENNTVTETQTETFDAALARFIAAAQANINAHYARSYENLTPPLLTFETGPKNVRIVSNDVGPAGVIVTEDVKDAFGNIIKYRTGRSVFCFVQRATGSVLKADGWKKPAKGIRGSIYTVDFKRYGISEYGANYAR